MIAAGIGTLGAVTLRWIGVALAGYAGTWPRWVGQDAPNSGRMRQNRPACITVGVVPALAR